MPAEPGWLARHLSGLGRFEDSLVTRAARLAALEKQHIGTAYDEVHIVEDVGGSTCHLGHEHCNWYRWPSRTLPGTILVCRYVGVTEELG